MSTPDSSSFVEHLVSFGKSLTQAERENYKLLLGLATGGLANDNDVRERLTHDPAFRATVSTLTRLQPYHDRVARTGTAAYIGRPTFLTDELLLALQEESATNRPNARRVDDHMLVSNAPVARSVGASQELRALISDAVGPVEHTGRANYLYYDVLGYGIDPHIDDEVFSLNCILVLRHEYVEDPSALVLFSEDGSLQHHYLKPGELIVFFADSIVHQRQRMKQDEKLSICALGFKPVEGL